MNAVLIIFAMLHGGSDGGASVKIETINFQTMAQCQVAAAKLSRPAKNLTPTDRWIGMFAVQAI